MRPPSARFFKFRITNAGGQLFDCNSTTGAEQNVSSSVGGAGQGIGYAGISPSVGVEFDTWCNSATRFDDGNVWYAWIDYDGTNLEARANQSGIRPVLSMLTRPARTPP